LIFASLRLWPEGGVTKSLVLFDKAKPIERWGLKSKDLNRYIWHLLPRFLTPPIDLGLKDSRIDKYDIVKVTKVSFGFCFHNYPERVVIRMTRKIGIALAVFITIVLFLYAPQAQTEEKKRKNTMALPNGDVIWDLNGEWDARVNDIRPGRNNVAVGGMTKITQTGSSFVGISVMSLQAFRKGSEQIKGELDKSGFKKVQIISSVDGDSDAKGEISEDGNEMIIDDGKRFKMIFTRK
jgi:hypothetical protein